MKTYRYDSRFIELLETILEGFDGTLTYYRKQLARKQLKNLIKRLEKKPKNEEDIKLERLYETNSRLFKRNLELIEEIKQLKLGLKKGVDVK